MESSISADTHFLSLSGTLRALSECFLQLSSATLKKYCRTCMRSQLQCLHYYHGPNFLKNGTHFFRRGTFYMKNRPKRARFYKKVGTFSRKRDLKGAHARICVSFRSRASSPRRRRTEISVNLKLPIAIVYNLKGCIVLMGGGKEVCPRHLPALKMLPPALAGTNNASPGTSLH